MVGGIVTTVMADTSNRRVTVVSAEPKKASKPKSKAPSAKKETPAQTSNAEPVGQVCPVCGKGRIIKGKTAYGCSEWRNGCTYRQPF